MTTPANPSSGSPVCDHSAGLAANGTCATCGVMPPRCTCDHLYHEHDKRGTCLICGGIACGPISHEAGQNMLRAWAGEFPSAVQAADRCNYVGRLGPCSLEHNHDGLHGAPDFGAVQAAEKATCPHCTRSVSVRSDQHYPSGRFSLHAKTVGAELQEVNPIACKGSYTVVGHAHEGVPAPAAAAEGELLPSERIDLTRAIAESDIAGCSLENADIDALVDMFQAWLERRGNSVTYVLAGRVVKAAAVFCEDLQEDADGVPQDKLRELHAALDAYEGTPADTLYDDSQVAMAGLQRLAADPTATDNQRRIATLAMSLLARTAAHVTPDDAEHIADITAREFVSKALSPNPAPHSANDYWQRAKGAQMVLERIQAAKETQQ